MMLSHESGAFLLPGNLAEGDDPMLQQNITRKETYK